MSKRSPHEYQKHGIGSQLIKKGIKASLQPGYDSVIGLGIPDIPELRV